MDDLTALEGWLAPLLARLAPARQRQLAQDLARDLRRAQARRIAAQRNPDGSAYAPRKPREAHGHRLRDRRGRLRRQMFRKIRQAAHLRLFASPAEAAIGFSGRVARIAAVHQWGLSDPVQPGGPEVVYARRQLLGFTAQDLEALRDRLLRALAG